MDLRSLWSKVFAEGMKNAKKELCWSSVDDRVVWACKILPPPPERYYSVHGEERIHMLVFANSLLGFPEFLLDTEFHQENTLFVLIRTKLFGLEEVNLIAHPNFKHKGLRIERDTGYYEDPVYEIPEYEEITYTPERNPKLFGLLLQLVREYDRLLPQTIIEATTTENEEIVVNKKYERDLRSLPVKVKRDECHSNLLRVKLPRVMKLTVNIPVRTPELSVWNYGFDIECETYETSELHIYLFKDVALLHYTEYYSSEDAYTEDGHVILVPKTVGNIVREALKLYGSDKKVKGIAKTFKLSDVLRGTLHTLLS